MDHGFSRLNKGVKMNRQNLPGALLALTLAVVPARAWGQSSLDPGQLPKETAFYLAWHGMPSGDARKASALLALWDDPDFAPLRERMVDAWLDDSAKKQKAQAPPSRAELAEFASLLDNEFVAGYLSDPRGTPSKAEGRAPSAWNGGFLVYDRTGKESVLARLLLRAQANEKDPAKLSTVTLGGIPVIKAERKSGASYWAQDGKYALSASDPAVFEQIAGWAKRSSPARAPLEQTAAYREAGNLVKGGLVEFFFRFPSLKELAPDASAGGFRLRSVVEGLKLDAVHSIAGRLVQEGPRTRLEAAALGDVLPGTLFDLWDDGTGTPDSLAFVDASTVAYHESRMNLVGIYSLVKKALVSASGTGQPASLDFVETAAKTRLGMPIPEALGLFSGEFASLQTSATFDSAKQVYVVGIHKKPETLKLLRTAFADKLASERSEGDVTYLKVSQAGIETSAGTASWKYYHLAVTPETILACTRSDTLRSMLGARKGSNGRPPLLPESWQSARAKFPKAIDGLSFLDFQKVDWPAMKAAWTAEAPGKARRPDVPAPAASVLDSLKQIDPQVFSRRLHLTASASWKDPSGVHFDGWIE
jgi:hypothetical protein